MILSSKVPFANSIFNHLAKSQCSDNLSTNFNKYSFLVMINSMIIFIYYHRNLFLAKFDKYYY